MIKLPYKEPENMITVKDFRYGTTLPKPIYKYKPYIVLGKERVILHAGTKQSILKLSSYYDDCEVKAREHDLYLNDNTRL